MDRGTGRIRCARRPTEKRRAAVGRVPPGLPAAGAPQRAGFPCRTGRSALVVRLPRRSMGADLIRVEQRWLPALTGHLPVRTSVPVRVGAPSSLYPCAWSIAEWIEGRVGSAVPAARRRSAAQQLAEFLLAFQQPAPRSAPDSPVGRGGPLAARSPTIRARLDA
ncbi:phosphotransferase, partial [Arthrobacter sp. Br18]|uniref:phosphotransferase n=1 Tax=Arthrobacter sp. Br18 TaxID=1312954 RepID=UPI0023B8840C